jgi:hypothetical protein
VYITFTLIGAGIGLLLGSYISALKEEQEEFEPENEEHEESNVNPLVLVDVPTVEELDSLLEAYYPDDMLEEEIESDKDDWPDEEEAVEETKEPKFRFTVHIDDPRTSGDVVAKKTISLIYSGDTDKLSRKTKGSRNIDIPDVEGTLGEGTMDAVLQTLLNGGKSKAFVWDSELETLYSIQLLKSKK